MVPKHTRPINTDNSLVLYHRGYVKATVFPSLWNEYKNSVFFSISPSTLSSFFSSSLPAYYPLDFPIPRPPACFLRSSWRRWVWLCLFAWLSTPPTSGWVSARSWTNLSPLTSTSIPPRSTTPAGKTQNLLVGLRIAEKSIQLILRIFLLWVE